MSEVIIASLIGAGVTLLSSITTLIVNVLIERFKSKREILQREQQLKIDCLNDIYKELIFIINQYPNVSPNDILKCVEFPPNYSMESFDSILQSLDYQIEDYKEKLNVKYVTHEQKSSIEVQISNREYSKKIISEIRDKYFNAQDKYELFCESNKAIFDLYAGQIVRNHLIEFEITIQNVFKSGYSVGNANDLLNNCIEIARRKLIDSIRDDIGMS